MKWKIRESQQLRPFGGHHLVAHGIRFEGNTPVEVVKKVTDYRVHNSIPVGEPMKELLDYYAAKWPFMVDEDYDTKPEPPPNTTKEKWMGWVRQQWKFPRGKYIANKEAEARWKVCLTCPFNKPIETQSQEEREIARKSFLMSRGVTMPARLGFCSLHLADIRTMVVLEAPSVVSDKPKDAANHPGCWVA